MCKALGWVGVGVKPIRACLCLWSQRPSLLWCLLGGALKIFKAPDALSPTPGTSARVRRDERDEGGELARLTHSPARVLTRARDARKLESHMLVRTFHFAPWIFADSRTEGGIKTEKNHPAV